MIRFKIGGGLGNQMFQYAFLYSQMKKMNKLSSPVEMIMHRNKNEDLRNFTLDVYNCSIPMKVTTEDKTTIDYFFINNFRKVICKTCRLLQIPDSKIIMILNRFGIIYAPDIYEYYDQLKVNNNTQFIEGAFQSWKYFDVYRQDIISEFLCKEKISLSNEKILNMIKRSNSVCVHIRRGDYVNSFYSKSLAICNYDYYEKGIRYICEKVNNPHFFIFTNSHEDHEWIKKKYHFDVKVTYVDLNNTDYDELRLMSYCKHFIIANSTFSWWAQYLSTNKEKIVVAPSIWNRDVKNTQELYQNFWKLIDVN